MLNYNSIFEFETEKNKMALVNDCDFCSREVNKSYVVLIDE